MVDLSDTPAGMISRLDAALQRRGETISIRRYAGAGGSRTATDYTCRARVIGYDAAHLVGSIKQGFRRLIVSANDLTTASFPFPVIAGDKAVIRGKECTIEEVDDNTRRAQGVLIGLELKVSG